MEPVRYSPSLTQCGDLPAYLLENKGRTHLVVEADYDLYSDNEIILVPEESKTNLTFFCKNYRGFTFFQLNGLSMDPLYDHNRQIGTHHSEWQKQTVTTHLKNLGFENINESTYYRIQGEESPKIFLLLLTAGKIRRIYTSVYQSDPRELRTFKGDVIDYNLKDYLFTYCDGENLSSVQLEIRESSSRGAYMTIWLRSTAKKAV